MASVQVFLDLTECYWMLFLSVILQHRLIFWLTPWVQTNVDRLHLAGLKGLNSSKLLIAFNWSLWNASVLCFFTSSISCADDKVLQDVSIDLDLMPGLLLFLYPSCIPFSPPLHCPSKSLASFLYEIYTCWYKCINRF